MKENLFKAKVLLNALPFIRKYHQKILVIKYGGSVMGNTNLRSLFMQDVVLMKYVGMHPVIVHGGGPEINIMLKKLGKKSEFIDGFRVTDAETVSIVEMVLSGKINKKIVADINYYGGKAIGLSGKDNHLINVYKKTVNHHLKPIDLGFVGEICNVNGTFIEQLCQSGVIPVISSIGADAQAQTYNINADDVAASIAAAINAERLIYLTDIDGIMENPNDKQSLISDISQQEIENLINQGIIYGGMLPKIKSCLYALQQGVNNIVIVNGKEEHAILLELLTKKGLGTLIHH